MKNIEILYEDKFLLVLNKPSGIVVNKSKTSPTDTLQDWLLENFPKIYGGVDTDSEFGSRVGLVHRLDKDTSGVIIVAKTPEVFEKIQKQFKNREVKKEYVALVFGDIEEGVIEINAPLDRNPRARTKMAVVEGGRPSVTRIERIRKISSENEVYTLIKAMPRTGRTHQIRVHLTALNHPVVGDILYAGRRRSNKSRDKFGRLMLHAHKITFIHPISDEQVLVEAPIPSEFEF